MGPIHTLVVDDDELTREMLGEVLAREGHEVSYAADGAEAQRKLATQKFDLVISDIQMATVSGLELLETMRTEHPDTPLVLVTAYADPNVAMDAMSRGAADYLTKPVDLSALLTTVNRALDRRKLAREHRALLREVLGKRSLIGTSPAMIELYKQLAQVAATNATIYIHGESGSGKELVAHTLHERSRRATAPFVAVNCAALTESLLESELFGHEKGAFTGAQSTRRGLFEEASGGTLFLDEIGDISAKVQAQLLRVLQEGEIRRVGGNQPIEVDVRVITATHRDLQVEMEQGRIRSDLFYRLSVVTLEVPSLRDRGEDLLALTRHFAARHSLELGRPNPEISEAALAVIREHRWPGNVRELENAMARAVAMCRGDVILPSDLPPTVLRVPAPAELRSGVAAIDSDWPTLEVLEQRYIAKALDHTEQNKTAAAQLLGIDRRTLQRMGNKD